MSDTMGNHHQLLQPQQQQQGQLAVANNSDAGTGHPSISDTLNPRNSSSPHEAAYPQASPHVSYPPAAPAPNPAQNLVTYSQNLHMHSNPAQFRPPPPRQHSPHPGAPYTPGDAQAGYATQGTARPPTGLPGRMQVSSIVGAGGGGASSTGSAGVNALLAAARMPNGQEHQSPLGQANGHPPSQSAPGIETMDHDDDESTDSDDVRGRKGPRTKKPHLQGRFSGRLATKEDEKRLGEECRLLAPLLGGVGKRGDRSRLTLAKIVRGIARGDIRRHLEAREQSHKVVTQQLTDLQSCGGAAGTVRELQQQITLLKHELEAKSQRLAEVDGAGTAGNYQSTSGLPPRQDPKPIAQPIPIRPVPSILAEAPSYQLAPPPLHIAPTHSAGLGIPPLLKINGTNGSSLSLEQQMAGLQADLQAQQHAVNAAAQNHATATAQAQQLRDQVQARLNAYPPLEPGQDANAAYAHDQTLWEMTAALQRTEALASGHAQAHSRAQLQVDKIQSQMQGVQGQLNARLLGNGVMHLRPSGGGLHSSDSGPAPYVLSSLLPGYQLVQQAGPHGTTHYQLAHPQVMEEAPMVNVDADTQHYNYQYTTQAPVTQVTEENIRMLHSLGNFHPVSSSSRPPYLTIAAPPLSTPGNPTATFTPYHPPQQQQHRLQLPPQPPQQQQHHRQQ